MCGGRGIRPTSLPRALKLGVGGQIRHSGRSSSLCWRLVTTDHISDVGRVVLDQHGWPADVAVSDEWRRQIDRAAVRTSSRVAAALPPRLTLKDASRATVATIRRDTENRLWADVWGTGETAPTSFRLTQSDATRYDIRRSKNDALSVADPPRPLPAWCSREVAHASDRFLHGQK